MGMDFRNGDLYDSPEAARAAGVPESSLVAFRATAGQALRVSAAVKAAAEEEARLLAKERHRKRHANDHPPKVRV